MSRRKIKRDRHLTAAERRQKKIDRKTKRHLESRTQELLRRRDELLNLKPEEEENTNDE
jgi:hypothetical protein